VTDVHPVFGPGVSQDDLVISWNDRLTQFYKDNSDSARFLFKVAATFGFIIAVIVLLALAA
jgi:hypothetical protein